jgi:hypothetical protein
MALFGNKQAEPETVDIEGRALVCQFCKDDTFWYRKAQLHGPMLSFLDVEWMSPTAMCLICSQCGYVHWFVQSA